MYAYIYILTLLVIIIVGALISTMVCVYQPDNYVELVLFYFYVGPGVVTQALRFSQLIHLTLS